MADWATISSLATAGGTLVLAVATFASVRSANRSARVAETSLLSAMRPLLVPTRLSEDIEKVGFGDDEWLRVRGGRAIARVGADAVYLALSLRNVGSGLAVLQGWHFEPERTLRAVEAPPLESFRMLIRDLYIAPGDSGFWQGAYRDPDSEDHKIAQRAVEARQAMTVDVLYADQEGGQRMISRFALIPVGDGEEYLSSVARHWNLDRADPRQR